MPRAPRINIDEALYYVTSNGIQGQNLFNDGEDYLMYLELLGKYKSQHGFKLFAFALMPTHVHMLTQTQGGTTLSDIMHNVTSSYTKYYNRKYNRQGHLFRGRYRATVIEKEPYLLKMIRYIHFNPKEVGLGMQDYQYSSYSVFENGGEAIAKRVDMRQEVKEALGMMGDKKFGDFMNEGSREDGLKLHRELHRRLFLGSDEFGKKIQEYLDKASKDGEFEDEEAPGIKKIIIPMASGLLLIALAVGGFGYYNYRNKIEIAKKKAIQEEEDAKAVDFSVKGLNGFIWQIKFIAGTPLQIIDNLYFEDGKMFSDNLSLNGYVASNYSSSKQDKTIIWETMQIANAGTAFWHGQIEDGRMRGELNLRPTKGEPQDFSFVSLKYKKIKKELEVQK